MAELPTLESFFPQLTAAQGRSTAAHESATKAVQSAGTDYLKSLDDQFDVLKQNTTNTLSTLDDLDKSLQDTYEGRDEATKKLREIRGMPSALSNLRVLLGDESYSGPAQATKIAEAGQQAEDLEAQKRTTMSKHKLTNTLLQAEGAKEGTKYNHLIKSVEAQTSAADRAVSRVVQQVGLVGDISADTRAAAVAHATSVNTALGAMPDALMDGIDESQNSVAFNDIDIPVSRIIEERSRRGARDETFRALVANTDVAVALANARIAAGKQTLEAGALSIELQQQQVEAGKLRVPGEKLTALRSTAELEARAKDPDLYARAATASVQASIIENLNKVEEAVAVSLENGDTNLTRTMNVMELEKVVVDGYKINLPNGTTRVLGRELVDGALTAAREAQDKRDERSYAGYQANINAQTLGQDFAATADIAKRFLPGDASIGSRLSRFAQGVNFKADSNMNPDIIEKAIATSRAGLDGLNKEIREQVIASAPPGHESLYHGMLNGKVDTVSAIDWAVSANANAQSMPKDNPVGRISHRVLYGPAGIMEKFVERMSLDKSVAGTPTERPTFESIIASLTKDDKVKSKQVMRDLMQTEFHTMSQKVLVAEQQKFIWQQFTTDIGNMRQADWPAEMQESLTPELMNRHVFDFVGFDPASMQKDGVVSISQTVKTLQNKFMPDGRTSAMDWLIHRVNTEPKLIATMTQRWDAEMAKHGENPDIQANKALMRSAQTADGSRTMLTNLMGMYRSYKRDTLSAVEMSPEYAAWIGTPEMQRFTTNASFARMKPPQQQQLLRLKFQIATKR